MLKTACHPKLLVLWLLYAGLIAFGIYALGAVGFSYDGCTKDAIVWAVIVGLPMLTRFDKVGREPGTLWPRLREAVRLTAFVEFYVNLYVFPLAVEIVLQAFLVTVAMMAVVAQSDPEHRQVRRLIDGVLVASGVVMLLVVTRHIVHNHGVYEPAQVVLSFANPVILTVAVLGLTLVVAKISRWEQARIRRRVLTGGR